MSKQVDIEFTSGISDELHEKLADMLKDAGVIIEEYEENYYVCDTDPCGVVDSWASEFELSFRLSIYTDSGGSELQYMFGKLLDEMVDFDECYRVDSEEGYRELYKMYPKGALCSFKEHSTVLYLIRVNGAGTWRFDREVDHIVHPISEKFLSSSPYMNKKKLIEETEKQNKTTESAQKESEFKQLDGLVDIFCSIHNKLKYKAFTDKTKQMIVDVLPIDVDDLMLDAVITAVMNGTNVHYCIGRYLQEVYKGYHLYILYGSAKYIYESTGNSEFKRVRIMTIDKFKSIIDSVEKPEEKTSPTPDVSEYHVETPPSKTMTEIEKVKEAYLNGATIEYKIKSTGEHWHVKKSNLWSKECDYRIAEMEIGQCWEVHTKGCFVGVEVNVGDTITLITDKRWEQSTIIGKKYIYLYNGEISTDYYKMLSDIAQLIPDVPTSKTLTELDKVKEAYSNGAKIEAFYEIGNNWYDVYTPQWHPKIRYRVKSTESIGVSKADDSYTMVTEIVKKQDDLIEPNLVTLTIKKDRHKSVHSIDVSNRYEDSSETLETVEENTQIATYINPTHSEVVEKPHVSFSDTVDKYVERRRTRKT